MQHNHVLKKLNFDLFTLSLGSLGKEDLRAKYLLPCRCIHDSLKFNIQHDRVLIKLSFDPKPGIGGGGGLQAKYLQLRDSL